MLNKEVVVYYVAISVTIFQWLLHRLK